VLTVQLVADGVETDDDVDDLDGDVVVLAVALQQIVSLVY
jgi:hypothetical protein